MGCVGKLITVVQFLKLLELIEASKEVKGYGPVRAESYEIFKSRINFTSKKGLRVLSNNFRYETRNNIQPKKHKARKDNRAEW